MREWLRRARPALEDPATGPATMRQTARRLLGYTRGHRVNIVVAIGLYFASSAIDPLVPAYFKQLIDNGFKPSPGFALWTVPVAIVGLFTIRGLLAFGGTYLFSRANSDLVLALRTDMIHSVMTADARLYAELSPGVVASRVISDPQNSIGSLSNALTTVLRDGTTLLALLSYLFYLNWQLTLITLVTIPMLALVVHRVQSRVLAVSARSYESQVRLIGIVDDITRAWRVVRTFDAADFERRRFREEAARLRRATLQSIVAGATMTPLTQLVASAGVALIVTLALAEGQHRGATVGEFVAFVTTLLMTISPMRHLTDVTQPMVGGLVQARACLDLLDVAPEPDQGTTEVPASRGHLRFEAVTVRYPGSDRPAIADVDIDIPSGRVVAFVGPSGGGKSTLIDTMLAFVAPASGRVLFDGIDIRTVRKAALRRQFAVVSQEIVLFEASIAANVVYAQPADPERVEASLRAADLWDFTASLPERGQTRIGTNGSRLSGGQRQRLAIARAFYKEASVWVLDEATSALDSASERAVHAALARLRGNRTLVLVAHRLSTVRDADVIYVMSDGRVVESGCHRSLMERGGVYAGMAHSQRLS